MIGRYVGESDPYGSIINGKEYVINGPEWDDTMFEAVDEYRELRRVSLSG